jgi:hypothetical protein
MVPLPETTLLSCTMTPDLGFGELHDTIRGTLDSRTSEAREIDTSRFRNVLMR